ncbi:vicilin-like seed storage protein At2g18540 [Eucalyptus grandis]|uniref:vicilin-like seed storage protein At2g18540 n=1 Tax=Eucalyptus grandis TaxID=71139 RepID=UPI00192E7732|nr:vicilin-like seed storage protein At2g18540 [Eucalyptus grandis]
MRERPDYSAEEEEGEERKPRRKSRDAPETDGKMRESSETSKRSRESSDLGNGERKSSRRSEKTRGSSDSEEIEERRGKKSGRTKRRRSRRRYSSESGSDDSGSEDADSESESESESEGSGSVSESEEERRRRRRKRREKRRREEERERKRRKKDKEKRRRRSRRDDDEGEEEERSKKKKKKEEKKKKERKKGKQKERAERGKTGAVTNCWGKYGIIRETDMWNKRPEFTAWLAEVKKVNLESLANWEEKQMFKEFMEDHNTATFPSKKYYNLDAYHRHQMEKELKKGLKKVVSKERIVFNDEEQRRQELMVERERQKEQEVETLKRSMQGGMAQAMKEQALLREEMAYQYKLGNFEAAAAIQRRLDPNIAM